jgi:ubiquinone/menaquinone biosynthesis C-methylase UbiE
MGGADGRYDRALIFFLLHEQPEAVRRAALREVARVVRPGGRVLLCGGLYQVLALTIAPAATRQSESEFGKLCL